MANNLTAPPFTKKSASPAASSSSASTAPKPPADAQDPQKPITDAASLRAAIRAFDPKEDTPKQKTYIISRAKALKLESLLPAGWSGAPFVAGKMPAKEAVEVEGEFTAREVFTASEAVFKPSEGEAPGSVEAEIVIIRPGESANHRKYGKEAIARAVQSGFWNGSKMFLDHSPDSRMPMKRSIKDLVSGITTTTLGSEGEARGTVRFFNQDFARFAQEAQDHIGVSIVHEFKGRRFRGADGIAHEEVDEFVVNHSVDWVAFPAAGGGIDKFLPARESEDDVEWSELTADMLRTHAPKVFDEISASAQESDEGNPIEPVGLTTAEVRRIAQEAVADARIAWDEDQTKRNDAKAKVAALVGKAGLPERTRQRVMGQFDGITEFAQESVQAAIDEARAELKDAGSLGPMVRGLGASAAESDKPADAKTLAERAPTMTAFESQMGYTRSAGGDS